MIWILHITISLITVSVSAAGYASKLEVSVPFQTRAACITSLHMIEDEDGTTSWVPASSGGAIAMKRLYTDKINMGGYKAECLQKGKPAESPK